MKAKLWTVLIAALAVSCAVPYSAPPTGITGGEKVSPITMSLGRAEFKFPGPVPMAGYGNRYKKKSQGVHDPIFARCIIMNSGGKKFAIVGSDILLISAELRTRVLQKVADLKIDTALFAATHTHGGPGGYVNSFPWEAAALGTYGRKTEEIIADTIAESIENAAAAKPFRAKMSVASMQQPDYIRNRRHEGGPVDPTLSVIVFTDESGKSRAVIVNYGAHGTVLTGENRLLSGDYPGELERQLEKNVELAMYLAGDIGDQMPYNPAKNEDPSTFEDVEVVGKGLAESAWAMVKAADPVDFSLSVAEENIAMPEGDLNKACFGAILHAPLEALGKRILPKSALFQAWRMGDALILTSPGEMAHEIGMALRNNFPETFVIPASHSNDYIGYVISKEEYAQGGYESCMNFYGPGFASILIQTLTDLGKDAR